MATTKDPDPHERPRTYERRRGDRGRVTGLGRAEYSPAERELDPVEAMLDYLLYAALALDKARGIASDIGPTTEDNDERVQLARYVDAGALDARGVIYETIKRLARVSSPSPAVRKAIDTGNLEELDRLRTLTFALRASGLLELGR